MDDGGSASLMPPPSAHLSEKIVELDAEILTALRKASAPISVPELVLETRWGLRPHKSASAITIVLVDLGNVHDCLKQCEEERARGNINAVYGFANVHFNAYGVNPPPRDPKTKVAVVKDGVDVAIVWKACELSHAATDAGNSLKLVIATKSHKLEPLTALVKSAGHEVRFVRTAAGL